MENEFIPYEESLELKKLGFNESCLAYYNERCKLFLINTSSFITKNDYIHWKCRLYNIFNRTAKSKLCTAPTFPAVFKWIRKVYGIQCFPDYIYYDEFHYGYRWVKKDGSYGEWWYDAELANTDEEVYHSPEIVQIEFLKELIKMIKKEHI